MRIGEPGDGAIERVGRPGRDEHHQRLGVTLIRQQDKKKRDRADAQEGNEVGQIKDGWGDQNGPFHFCCAVSAGSSLRRVASATAQPLC